MSFSRSTSCCCCCCGGCPKAWMRSCSISRRRLETSSSRQQRFWVATVLIALTEVAKRNVLMVSDMDSHAGEMFANMCVLELPAKESLSSQVNFEALNGIPPAVAPFFVWRSLSSLITSASALNPLLIAQPCFMTKPSACTLDCRSAPARSTRLIRECNSLPLSPSPPFCVAIVAVLFRRIDFSVFTGCCEGGSTCWIFTTNTA
mmetsp:Transcript_125596/g.351736  ORF Transcript_125596/g.351736 Transcript_125596/m.351736 type:complete len:204 (-) Transcript_125596:681-1292(-)